MSRQYMSQFYLRETVPKKMSKFYVDQTYQIGISQKYNK